jgi:hypothetical protein
MPTMAAMGIDVAGSASETPPTKTTASRPVGGGQRVGHEGRDGHTLAEDGDHGEDEEDPSAGFRAGVAL